MPTGEPPPAAIAPRRVCLLTGAGGTLGDTFCWLYAQRYDIVAVCRRRRPRVASQHESFVDPVEPDVDLPENRGQVYIVTADLEQEHEIERIVDIALARFGHVDLLVNNAAYSNWHPQGVVDGTAALRDVDRHFSMNVGVPLRLAVRLAQQSWVREDLTNRARNRNVVNVSSLAGSKLFPHQGQGIYAASKAALNQLTRHLGSEFASFGVRVNAVAPNSFPSIVSTESVARAVVRLDEESVTGRVLVLDADALQASTPADP